MSRDAMVLYFEMVQIFGFDIVRYVFRPIGDGQVSWTGADASVREITLIVIVES